jgi:hypothetical protein
MNPIGWEILLYRITFAHNGREKMPDREQVIKALEKGIKMTEAVGEGWVQIKIEVAKKALELLTGEGKEEDGTR